MGHSHSDTDKKQIIGVAAMAAALGAVTALLFSSKKGSETRQAIRQKTQQLKAKAQDPIKEINEAAENAADVAAKAKTKSASKAKASVKATTSKK